MKNADPSGLDETLIEALLAQGAESVSEEAKQRVFARIRTTLVGAGASGVVVRAADASSSASGAPPAGLAGQAAPVASGAASVSAGANGFVGLFGPVMSGLGIGVLLGSGALAAWFELSPAAPHQYASATAVPITTSSMPRIAASAITPPQVQVSEQPPLQQPADTLRADTPFVRHPSPERRAPAASAAPPLARDDSALLETARAALARSDAQGALSALSQHRREFPRSAMTEEREALTIKALLARAQHAPAEAALSDFARRFPRSLFLPALRAAISDKP